MGRLNARQVETAKPGEKDVYLRDGDGLELRIMPAGKRIWQFRYQHDGKRNVIGMGGADFVSLKDARKLAHDARELLDKGICPRSHAQELAEADRQRLEEEARERASIKTFEDVANEWLELEAFSRRDSGKEARRLLDADVLPYIRSVHAKDVTKAQILSIIDRIKKRGSLVHANHVFAHLRQIFNWCLRRDIVDRSPMMNLSKERDAGGIQKSRKRNLSGNELLELNDAMAESGLGRPQQIALWLQLSTLTRIGEILKARWEHVDFDRDEWFIPSENSKNGKAHVVFLSNFSKRHFLELECLTGKSAWCFPATRRKEGHVYEKSVTQQVRDRQREEPMKGRSKAVGTLILSGGTWTPHDLRRTGTTLVASLGIHKEIASLCLNHVSGTTSDKMLDVYDRYERINERREAFARLGERLDELLHDKARTVIPMIRKAV